MTIAVASVIVYLEALRARFVEDDWVYLDQVQQPGWWHSAAVWHPGTVLWRPLLFVWFGLLHAAFGLHPLPYHLASEAVILVEAALTFLLARRLGLGVGAVIAGAVVCLHASMATPVAWTSAASSPVSVAFALGALLVTGGHSGRPRRWILSGALLACGLLTREVVVVTPLIAMVIDAIGRRDLGIGRRLARAAGDAAGLWAVVVAYAAVRLGSGMVSTGPYQQHLGPHALPNLGHLAEFSAQVWFTDRVHAAAAVTAVLWLVALVAVVRSVRGDRLQPVIGLGWAVLAVLPVVFLAYHLMDPYYIDLALPGLGLAAGGVVEHASSGSPRWSLRRPLALGVSLACLVAVGAVASRSEVHAYFSGPAARTAMLESLLRSGAVRPVDGVLHLSGMIDADRYITADGDLYRVLLHAPRLRIVSSVPLGPS